MPARKTKLVSDQMRNAIKDSGLSQYRIAVDCDIDKTVISRFVAGKVGVTLATFDRLADYLGLELKKKKPKKTS